MKSLFSRPNLKNLQEQIHIQQKNIIRFIKERRTIKVLHIFRNYSAFIVVLSSALLVSATNLSAGKESSGFLFGYFGNTEDNYENPIAKKMSIQTDKKTDLVLVPLSEASLAPDPSAKLAEENLSFRLAISLHGATDEVRSQIMPVNKAFPLGKLIPAVRIFNERHGRMITLEFILIEDINDSIDQAIELRGIALDLHAHVNLIPYNTVDGLPWKRPSVERQEAFADVLRDADVSVTLRREKGHDIDAACGQLRLKTEKSIA